MTDWAELRALIEDRPLSRGKIETIVTREDTPTRTATSDIWAELDLRSQLMRDCWPLRLDDGQLIPTELNWLYVFLAILGLRYNVTPAGRELFEHCVTELVTGLTATLGIRVGFPRRAPVPTSLADAVERYCVQSQEELGIMKPPPLTDGDLGLDVVSWKAFDDARGGYLHFIGQCATGADWEDKLTELNVWKWGDHISWAVPPVRFFATPFVVHPGRFRRASKDGGLLLDRPRLMALERISALSPELSTRIKEYCEQLYEET